MSTGAATPVSKSVLHIVVAAVQGPRDGLKPVAYTDATACEEIWKVGGPRNGSGDRFVWWSGRSSTSESLKDVAGTLVTSSGPAPSSDSAADGVTRHFDSGMSNARFNRNEDDDSGARNAGEVARTSGGSRSTMAASNSADIRDLLRDTDRITCSLRFRELLYCRSIIPAIIFLICGRPDASGR